MRANNGVLTIAVLTYALLGGCADEKPPVITSSAAEQVRIVPVAPIGMAVSSPLQAATGNRPRVATIIPATAPIINSVRSSANVQTDGAISLNFSNTDIREVLRIVLGEILGVGYSVDPTVQGTISLETVKPVNAAALLSILEDTLAGVGLAIVRSGNGYNIIPLRDAPRRAAFLSTGGGSEIPGYTVQVIPLQYVSPDELRRILEPMVPEGTIIRTDPGRGLIIVGGTSRDLSTVRQTVEAFDIDGMRGMTIAVFPLQNVDARTAIAELNRIFEAARPGGNSSLRFVSLDRLNSVLAVSAQPRNIDNVKRWIAQIDQPSSGPDRQLFVYKAQHSVAGDLAKILTKVFGTEDAASRPPSPSNQPNAQDSSNQPSANIAGSAPPPNPLPPAYEGTEGIPFSVLQNIRVIADDSNNSLLILATTAEYKLIESALRKLDIAPLQVLVEAMIAEVTLTNDLKFGVQYFFQSGGFGVNLSNRQDGTVTTTFPNFAISYTNLPNIRVALNALSSVTQIKVISAPQLMVLSNQTATLQIGDQVPITSQSAVSVAGAGAPIVSTFAFKDTGVILKITPRVNPGGKVVLNIDQEVSSVVPTTTSNIDSPTIQQRKVSSRIAVRDAETIALGGLIRDSVSSGRTGVPFLKDIPILGEAFKNNTDTNERTELIILLTPRVIQDDNAARAITEELKLKVRQIGPLVQKVR